MPNWIFLCCRRPLRQLAASRLAAGIIGDDPQAPAGVDYLTLAEDYPVGRRSRYEDLVAKAVDEVTVARSRSLGNVSYEIRYAPWPAQPILIYRWDLRSEGKAILQSLIQKGAPPDRSSAKFRELVGIQLRCHQLEDMGIVFAYEVARYLGQRGDAVILNDQGEWQEVVEGEWSELGSSISRDIAYSGPTEAALVLAAKSQTKPFQWLLSQARRLFLEFGGSATEAAALLAALQVTKSSRGARLPEFVDALADDALDNGGPNFFAAPPSVMRLLHQFVGGLPQARAEALLAPPNGVRWRFILDRQTPYLIDRAVAEVRDWPKVTNVYLRAQAIEALPRLGVEAVDPLINSLDGHPPQRLMLLASLAAIGSPDGLPVLVSHLSDSVERVRQVAEWGLSILGPEVASSTLENTARSKKKAPANAAQRLLRSWKGGTKSIPLPTQGTERWCEGCGLVMHDHRCPWCGNDLRAVPTSPWRAFRSRACPVNLQQA